jgi:hypothetical protein
MLSRIVYDERVVAVGKCSRRESKDEGTKTQNGQNDNGKMADGQ